MATVRIQGESEKQKGIYYEYDPSDTPLGEGGMGMVYKGWCCNVMTGHRKEVAIKFLRLELPPHVIARARREASVQLRNDNLIEMLGFVEINGRDELRQPVVRYHVVSEFLHGVTLDKLMNGSVTDYKGEPIPFAQELHGKFLNNPYSFAITIVRCVLSGLMALHDAGYIHRDIDPSNIMVTSDGKVKLIDFGIAKKVSGSNTNETSYTVDGQFIGKPKYAAPELVRGLVGSQNATTDLYAVGILLYQLLIGSVPFDGEMAEVLDMQLHKKMPLRNVRQKQIREVIRKATQKKRSLRYQSAAEFRVALDKLVPLQYPARTIDLRMISMIAGGAAVVAALIFGGIKMIDSFRNEPSDNQELIAEADTETTDESQNTRINLLSYNGAVELLADKSSADRGLDMLQELADGNDYQSIFLLSRLYFDGKESVKTGSFTDSVASFRKNLGISANNAKAHNLLKKAVALNENDYRSLYELGCDYKSKQRGAKFNTDSAYFFLNKARQLADKTGDMDYQQAIRKVIINL